VIRYLNACVMMMGLLAALLPRSALALDNSDCFTCHEDKKLTKKGTDGKVIPLFVDVKKYGPSVHGTNTCVSCHTDIKEVPHPDKFIAKPVSCAPCHEKAVSSYNASIHGCSRQAGNLSAATCADCHDKHDIQSPRSATSPLHREKQGAVCGKCHQAVMTEVRNSIHGKAMAHGAPDAPTCTDCHADHQISGLKAVSPLEVAKEVCIQCHASERFNARYNLPRDRVSTFLSSYHGMASKFGSSRSANCASCHGFHSVLPSSDPRSSVNKANMVKTCRKCHPEANENFSFGKIHLDETVSQSDIGSQISWWVRQIYLLLIWGVIGGMVAHNALVFYRKLIANLKRKDRTVMRMTRSQRIQHALLVSSFIVLAVTGFALKYPESCVRFLVGSSETVRRFGHRAAAVVMLVLAVYHTYYLIRTREGRTLVKDFCPRWKDVLDVIGNLRYLLFPRAPKPEFAKFGYAEKAEYWAVVWGTGIMGLTGLVIWFKMYITEWLPRWVIDVAITIHYYEAILAVLAIIVWHLYHVIFDPDVYPMSMAWWDGRVTEHWYREEHALDTKTLEESGISSSPSHGPSNEGKPPPGKAGAKRPR
jgi:cytochrome b subunit of formate dehydrogenase